jgi:hypothetical protein
MESSMVSTRRRVATPHLAILVLTVVLGLVVTGAASAEFPTKRSDPSVRGTAQEGQTLNGQSGQWLDANGLPCPDCSFRYTWQRCNPDGSGCGDIPGAAGLTYVVAAADVGRRIRIVEWIKKTDCDAHGKNCLEIEKNGVSAPTPLVTPKPISTAQASAPPTIQGLAMEEEIMRATGGTWTGPGTITKTIYWQRCNAVGEACATIDGATGGAYKLTSAEVGSRVRVIETAANEGGTAQSVSTPSAVVVELRPSASRPTIAAAKVSQPHRLNLRRITVKQVGDRVTVQVPVWDTRGFKVTGVLASLTPTGLLAGSRRERATNAQGVATFTFSATGSGWTYLHAEARKVGEKAQSGVWTAKLFRIRVR